MREIISGSNEMSKTHYSTTLCERYLKLLASDTFLTDKSPKHLSKNSKNPVFDVLFEWRHTSSPNRTKKTSLQLVCSLT